MFGACTWCKIGLAIVLAAIAALVVGTAIASGGAGAAIASALIGTGWFGSFTVVTATGVVVASPAFVTACGTIAAIIGTLIATGIGVALLGNLVCCRWIKIPECCIEGSTAFWDQLATLMDKPPVGDQQAGMLSADDCAALRRTIDRLRAERKIDADEAEKMRKALERHCPPP